MNSSQPGNLALFWVGIAGFKDELLHRLGRAANVEGILIDTAEAGAVPVPAVIMDMALHRNDIVADGTSEHIDSAAAHCVIANVKHKGMREDALLGAGGHIMRFVIACFKQAREACGRRISGRRPRHRYGYSHAYRPK